MIPAQGELWWAEAEDKRRPVLVVSRSEAIPVLTWIIVAPVTRTVRDAASSPAQATEAMTVLHHAAHAAARTRPNSPLTARVTRW